MKDVNNNILNDKNFVNYDKINQEIASLKNEKYQTKNYIFLNTKIDLLTELLNKELLSYLKISKLFYRVYNIKIKPETIRNFAIKELKIESFQKRKNKYIDDSMISNKDIENYKILYNLFMEEIYDTNNPKSVNFGEMEYLSSYLKEQEDNKNIFKMLFLIKKENIDIQLKDMFETFLKNIEEKHNDDYKKY